jgi:hypothetical protein
MDYLFQEGHFTLPAIAWQDCTVNILKNPQTGASLVITRGIIPQGATLEDEFEKQWQAPGRRAISRRLKSPVALSAPDTTIISISWRCSRTRARRY